jgi:hypothetical protein
MHKFLRKWGWEGRYVGIDRSFDPNVLREAERDKSTLLELDVDGSSLPFPPTAEHQYKQFAVAFVIQTIQFIEDQDQLIEELKRTCATIVLTAPSYEFKHWRPGSDQPTIEHNRLADYWGFQKTGYVNFNGRPRPSTPLYVTDNGKPETSSDIWGVWCDDQALYMNRDRDVEGFELIDQDGKVKQLDLNSDNASTVPGVRHD